MDSKDKKNFFGKLDKLQKGLYSRLDSLTPAKNPPPAYSAPESTPPVASEVRTDWGDEEKKPLGVIEKVVVKSEHTTMSLFKKMLLFSALFFVFSAVFAAFVFFGKGNVVSTSNVDISIAGPVSVGAGEVLSFDILIQNQNNVDLEGVNLLVEYPEGSRAADDSSRELLRDAEVLGTIPTGGVVKRSKQAILFGEASNIKSVLVSVEYRVKDSSATFFKEYRYDLVISTSPVRMTVSALKEVVSGKDMDLSVEITSNSATTVSGLMFRIDYPLGYNVLSSSPSPVFGNNVFLLGDMSPGEKRVIRVHGVIEGQDNEGRNFRFTLGLQDKQNDKSIGTVFLSSNHLVTIKKPFIGATLTFDGSSDNPYAVPSGQAVQGEISWSNNLPTRVTDFEIQAKINGESLDRLGVNATNGFYRSIDNVILWNKTTKGDFAVIEPGETGTVIFRFASLPPSALLYTAARGNELTVDISVKANRFSDTNVPEEIISTITRKIRISSNLALAARSLYYTGPITNQGPIPPVAERNTTYTVVWTLTNTLNNVSNAQVRATLPGYVTWTGTISPPGEIRYDSLSNEVVWDVGELRSGTGFQVLRGKFRSSCRLFQVSASVALRRYSLGPQPLQAPIGIPVRSSRRAPVKLPRKLKMVRCPGGMIMRRWFNNFANTHTLR